MLGLDPWLYWILTVAVFISILTVAVTCVCGCRKTVPKNELLGVDGKVKITNPEEVLNHNQQPLENSTCSVIGSGQSCADSSNVNKRKSTLYRSLPDIPIEQVRPIPGDTLWENGDTDSVRYAQVGGSDFKSPPANSISNRSSVREHPYDFLKREHQYAQVGASTSTQENSRNNEDAESNISGSVPHHRRVSLSLASSEQNIAAGPAISGQVGANPELPYVTPPITNGHHDSGDSQESKGGYTSISVREPLEKLKQQTQTIENSGYATVADDVEEVYEAIDDQSQIYTSGSETYAQIQTEASSSMAAHLAPQPPSVDSLKHVAQVHSRQASSSSATSSVANLGSPKPEKRQANSPLPPPPPAGSHSKALAHGISIEDMYAKVVKKKRIDPDHDSGNSMHAEVPPDASSEYSIDAEESSSDALDLLTKPETDTASLCSFSLEASADSRCDISAVTPTSGLEKPSSYSNMRQVEPGFESGDPSSIIITDNDPGYEVVRQSDGDPNYEELRPQKRGMALAVDPGYEKVRSSGCSHRTGQFLDEGSEPNYESMPSEIQNPSYAGSETDSNYEMVHHEDPNYESVNYFEVNSEPPYERLHNEEPRDSDNETVPGYEKVKYHNNVFAIDYEKVNNIVGSGESSRTLEAGYEEVGHKIQAAFEDVWKRQDQNK